MSIQQVALSSSKETLDFISSFETDKLVLIVPNLEFKKNLVDMLALQKGTVPDDLVLRLSEFLARLVKKNKPNIEFLDKKLFQVFLRQEFKRLGLPESDQYLVERSVEYISVYSPILAHERYRNIFEEYLAEDEVFKNIYSEIYPMMFKVWDMVLGSPYLIRQWSLGWLYQNLETLLSSKMNIVIFKPESLKKVELDFFEELSHTWNIYSVQNTSTQLSQINSKSLYWHKVITPVDELELITQIISEKELDWKSIKFIIPKKRVEYVKGLELFLKHHLQYISKQSFKEDKIKFHKIRLFISNTIKYIRIQNNEINDIDLKSSLLNYQEQFKNHTEFKKYTKNLIKPDQIENKTKVDQKNKINVNPDGNNKISKLNIINENLNSESSSMFGFEITNIDFARKYNFYELVESLHQNIKSGLTSYDNNTDSLVYDSKFDHRESELKLDNLAIDPKPDNFNDNSKLQKNNKKLVALHNNQSTGLALFLDWVQSMIIQTPVFIELSFENWFLYLESLIQTKTEQSLMLSEIPIQFLEDIEFSSSLTYFILGCSQQNYESSSYAYLSDLEVDKLKMDLGFNFESKEFSEQLYDDFVHLKQKGINPEVHFITPSYSLKSTKENDAKFLNQLFQNNFCILSDDKQSGFLSYFSNAKVTPSDVHLCVSKEIQNFSSQKEILKPKIARKYQSASSLQKYINCPFIYFSEYVLGLKTEEDLDLEPNAMLKGNLYHNALEKYLDRVDVNESEIASFLKAETAKNYSFWRDQDFIFEQLEACAHKIKNYISLDMSQKSLQGRKTLFKELDFECYFNLESLKFSKAATDKSDIKLIGKIDRIDTKDDKVYIFDYKLTKGKSFADWKKDHLLQMPIYGLMFVDGVLPIAGELAQLSYIIINDEFAFKNGLSVNYKDSNLNLGLTLNKSNSQTDFEALKSELNKFRELIKNVIQGINNLEFNPAPINPKACVKCDWKDACHARHLY